MATVKHVKVRNTNYTSAVQYLTYQHDEFTNKPILDENGEMLPREEFLIDGINCSPATFGRECSEINTLYNKNSSYDEIKAHHYIISFDPDDKTENGLTPERAQKIGMEIARTVFPGYQTIVCTHPDGHNSAGNIHCHIVLNSIRKLSVPKLPFSERKYDFTAGSKHRSTDIFTRYLKQTVMNICARENLYQIDLLTPAKIRISDREYWAQRKGQADLDKKNIELQNQGIKPAETKFKTEKGFLRAAITAVMLDSTSMEEFQKKLLAQYGIEVHESRGRFSYLTPDRNKPIADRKLGTDFEKEFIEIHFRRQVSKGIVTPIMDMSERVKIIKDTDPASANRYSIINNLKGKSATLIFMEENGLSGLDDLRKLKRSVNDDLYLKQKAVKDVDTKINQLRKQKRVTGQYFSTKKVYQQYLKAKDKNAFRQKHESQLRIYEAARKTLNEEFGGQDLLQISEIDKALAQLESDVKPKLVENLSFARKQAYKINIHEENYIKMLDANHNRSKDLQQA